MQQTLVVVLFFGLATSVYGLDLSHAAQPAQEIDPRLFNFINDFYAQVVYPPLNHVVTNLALLGAQLLAGISENGIPGPGGRTVYPTEAELRGFWGGLWNDAVKPPIENALSALSLMTAQVLAGIGLNGVNLGIGKREVTEVDARFLDALTQAINQVFTSVIQKPLEDALSNGALMLAQVLAGLGTNGVNLSNLGGLVGKRDAEVDARFLDALTQAINQVFNSVIQKPLEDALSNGALMLAQVLAGLGTNGVNLSNLGGLVGKRDAEVDARFLDALTQAINQMFTSVIQKPLEDALSNGALMLAQVLAGLGTNGVNLSNLGGLVGKRDAEVDARFLDALNQAINQVFTSVIQKPLEDALANGALMLAQVLAGLGTNGINLSNLGGLVGKREAEVDARFLDALTQAINQVFTSVIQKPLEDALSNGALMLAQVLAGLGTNGVNLSNLGGLVGKRDAEVDARFLDALNQAINQVFTSIIQKPLEDALSNGALMLAQVLAGLGTNGINLSNLGGLVGKRDVSEAELRGIFDNFGSNIVNGLQAVWNNIFQAPLENFIQTGALSAAQILAGLGTNGVSLGKREAEARGPVIDSLLDHANGLLVNQVKPVVENALNAAALHLAAVLANFSQNVIGRR